MDCCKHKKTHKKCIRNDGKTFKLPRRFTLKQCQKGVKGFTMRSSCAPYKNCKKQSGGGKQYKCISVMNMNSINGTVSYTHLRAHETS